MHRRGARRAGFAAVALTAVTLFAAPAAGAQAAATDTYTAKATGTALELDVFGQKITLGFSTADNASDPKSSGQGIGALLPGIGNVSDQTAAATIDTPNVAVPQACGPITLPPEFPVVDLATACSSASANVTNNLPSSDADAVVATVDVNANEILGQVSGQLNPAIGQLLDGLKPVFDALDQSGIDSDTLLNDIISAITEDGDLVRVALGPSSASTAATTDAETATAQAQGAVIKVLPRDSVALAQADSQADSQAAAPATLDPVLTITVGAATSTASVNRSTSAGTASNDPALVTVTIADDIADALNLPADQRTLSIVPGAPETCLLPDPLLSCISAASGTTTTDKGVAHAEASAVSLRLLTGIQGGITLKLAATTADAASAFPDVARVAADAPLARTGGTVDALLGGGLFAVAIGGMMLVRRSRRHAPLV